MPIRAGGGRVEMNEYQSWEHGSLEDVSHDTDAIIKMLGGREKMESFDSGLLTGMLSKQGVDPSIIALLDRSREDGSLGGNNGLLVLLFLILLLGRGGGFGWGGNDGVAGTDRTVVNEANYSRLLDAIGGNREAIAGLAQALNCDVNSIQSALCGVDKQLAVNQGSIINAIQNMGCQIGHQISSCCCDTRRAIDNQACQTRADIQDVRFLISSSQAAQDNLIQSQFAAQNAYLADQFCQIKMRELEATNQRLRDEVLRQSQNAQTAQILNAIANKDTIAYTGTITGSTVAGSGTLS